MTQPVPYHKKLHTLTIQEFNEQCLEIVAAISEHGGKAIIFDGDKTVAQITQYEKVHDPIRESLKDGMQIIGNTVSPTPAEWFASPNAAAISEHGGKAIIFDGDEPVAQITQDVRPYNKLRGSFKGRMQIFGDIVSPMPAEWFATPKGTEE